MLRTTLILLFLFCAYAESSKIMYVSLSAASKTGVMDSILSSQPLPFSKIIRTSLDNIDSSGYNIILITNDQIATSVEPILSWLADGKHVIILGGSDARGSNPWKETLPTLFQVNSLRQLTRGELSWGTFRTSHPLVHGLPPHISLPQIRSADVSYLSLADIECHVAISTESGFGHPVVFSKVIGSGLLTWIDIDMKTFNSFDKVISMYFKILLTNAFSSTPSSFINLRPSTLVFIAQFWQNRFHHEFSKFQKVLQSNLIDFDFVSSQNTRSVFDSSVINHYSRVIIFSHTNGQEDDVIKGIDMLVNRGQAVLFLGDFEKDFQFHITRRFLGQYFLDFSVSFPPILHIFDPIHPLSLGIPSNVTFSKDLRSASFPSGHDAVVIARNDVGLPVLVCKSDGNWKGGLIVHQSFKIFDDFISSTSSLIYIEKLILNFMSVANNPAVCKPFEKSNLVVVSPQTKKSDVSVTEYNEILKGIQRLLGGGPLETSCPTFQLSLPGTDLHVDFDKFKTILYLIDGNFNNLFEFSSLSSAIEKEVEVFIVGGPGNDNHATSIATSLFKFDTNNITWSVAASPVVTIVDSQNPIVIGLSKQHAFLADSNALKFNVRSPVDVHVIAKYGDGQPFLFSKNIGGFVFYYCVAPFKSWKEYDLVFQMHLIANFYL
ncbi:hypothetical protein RCL1_001127 [Eukaryota sp. TZLM3-RCL]